MRLTRLEIDGYGSLRDFRVEIAPGLHVFYGPNESGKSTLQRSILALLYGFYAGDRARAAENAARERDVPWQGGRYAARLEYALADESKFRVERDFSSSDVTTTIWDLTTGRDVTDDFGRGRHGNVPFARQQIGMTKEVFEGCAFVSQGELYEIAADDDLPGKIGDTITSLADTARRDVSAQDASKRLESILKESVGTSRSRTAPLPVARGRLQAARDELENLTREREGVADDAARLDETTAEADELRRSLTRNRYLLLQAQASELETLLAQLEALDDERETLEAQIEADAAFAAFPAEERESVRQRWNNIAVLREQIERDRPEHERAKAQLSELATQRTGLMRRREALSHLRDYPAGREESIDELARAWRRARTVAEEAARRLGDAAVPDEILAECERLEADVGRLTAADLKLLTERMRAPVPGWPAGALRASGRAVAAAGRWVWRQLVASGRWVANMVSRRPREATEAHVAHEEVAGSSQTGQSSAAEAEALIMKHLRYREVEPRVARFRRETVAHEEANAALESTAEQLHDALNGLVEERGDLNQALQNLSERLEGYRALQEVERATDALDRERSSRIEASERFENDQARLGRQEAALEDDLRRAVEQDAPLDALVEAFEAAARRRRQHDDATRSLRDSETRRGILLQGRSPGELTAATESARADQRRLLEEQPSLEGARSGETRQRLGGVVEAQQARLQELELEAREIKTRIDTRMAGLRPPAEVEEEVERYAREVAALERFGNELEIAREVVEQAMTEAHRDFAPIVGQYVGEHLARVTEGRYPEFRFDPENLRPQVWVPETRRLEDVEQLSRGTRAAAYLLLRIGLAQYMSALHEPIPIVLDDPLVDLDDMRLVNFLELLLELSSEVQILLFTKDGDTRDWFDRRCAASERHTITILRGPEKNAAVPAHMRVEPASPL